MFKKSDKNNKKNKRLQLQREIREIKINFFPRKKNDKWFETLKNNKGNIGSC